MKDALEFVQGVKDVREVVQVVVAETALKLVVELEKVKKFLGGTCDYINRRCIS